MRYFVKRSFTHSANLFSRTSLTHHTDIITNGEGGKNSLSSVTDTHLKKDAAVIFTNDRAGNLPTGVLSTIAGSLGIVAVGIAGIACGTYFLRKKKSEEQ